VAQLIVRGLEQETYELLKENAKANGRSLESEVRQILRQAAHSPKRSRQETEHALQRIHSMFAGRHFSDSAELIREDRDR
jgi:antitoxin FitA